jgi:hypothetical protein
VAQNYAYGFGRLDTTPYGTAHAQMNERTRVMFNNDPGAAYEWWMRFFNPSQTLERTLRMARDAWYQRYLMDQATKSPEEANNYRWYDWLRDFDINRELARLSPSARSEDPSRYVGRARWVAF